MILWFQNICVFLGFVADILIDLALMSLTKINIYDINVLCLYNSIYSLDIIMIFIFV